MPTPEVLVATDFSEPARNALDYALALAAPRGLPVRLVHAYQPEFTRSRVLVSGGYCAGGADPEEAASRERIRQLTKGIAGRKEAAGIPVSGHSTFNLIADEILRTADMGPIGLVVAGTTGAGADPEVFLGHTAAKILRGACTLPLLLVPSRAVFRGWGRIASAGPPEQVTQVFRLTEIFGLPRPVPVPFPTGEVLAEKGNSPTGCGGIPPHFRYTGVSDLLVLGRNRWGYAYFLAGFPVVNRKVFDTSVPVLVLPRIPE